MTYLLLANTVFEAIFGLLLIASPKTVLKGCEGLATAIARSFGVAEIAISVLSLMMVLRPDSSPFKRPRRAARVPLRPRRIADRGLSRQVQSVPAIIVHMIFFILFGVFAFRIA